MRYPSDHEPFALALSAILVMVALGACGSVDRDPPNVEPTKGPALLNEVSASEVVSAFTDAGLPATNPRDVTALKCSKLHCLQAVDTESVSVLKFPGPGPAQLYAGAISNAFQVEDVVITFAPTVTSDLKVAYQRVVERAAA